MLVLITLLMLISIDAFSIRKAFKRSEIRMSSASDLASKVIEEGLSFTSSQTLSSTLSSTDLVTIIADVQSNDGLWNEYKSKYDEYLSSLESKLRDEDKTVAEILGESSVESIYRIVESLPKYDKAVVTTFMNEPTVEKILSSIIYEAIFEFLQKVDLIGGIVNTLPVIGPIRVTIVKEFKKQLDRLLGPQIKTFLASYNRIAINRIIDLVVSEDIAFSKVNGNIVRSVLNKSINSYLPDQTSSAQLKEDVWNFLRGVDIENIAKIINVFYDDFGSVAVSELADVGYVLDRSTPNLRQVIVNFVEKFLNSEEGERLLAYAKTNGKE